MKAAKACKKDQAPDRRAEQILGAARKLFLKKGYQQTTIRDICQRSGLSNGTVYFHFKNKDAIYARIYEECFQYLNDMLAGAVHPDMAPLAQIEAALKTYLAFFIRHRDRWEMLDISYRRLALPRELIRRFDAMLEVSYDFVHTAVQAHLEEAGLAGCHDSRELALLLFTSVDGLLYDLKHGFFEARIKGFTLARLVDSQIKIFKASLTAAAQERSRHETI